MEFEMLRRAPEIHAQDQVPRFICVWQDGNGARYMYTAVSLTLLATQYCPELPQLHEG